MAWSRLTWIWCPRITIFFTLFRTNLGFYYSTKRFQVILPFYVLISVLFPTLVVLGIAPRSPDIYSYTQSGFITFPLSAALVAGLLAGDSLSQDFSRQGMFILSQPVKRSTILLSRYTAALVASGTVMVFFYDGIGASFAHYIYGELVPETWQITFLSLLYVAAAVAFVMLCSSAFRSSNVAIIVAVLSTWIVMPLITSVLAVVHYEPWFLLTYAGNVLQAVAQRTYPPPIQTVSIGGAGSNTPTETVYNPALWESVEIMAAYLVFSLALAWLAYSRRELKEAV